MRRSIAFDLSRLYVGGLGTTPRGIDRVEMSFARRLFDDPTRSDVGLVPTLSRMGVVPAAEARALTALVDRHWRESRPPGEDARYAALRLRLEHGPGATLDAPPALPRPTHPFRHVAAMLWQARWSGLRPARRAVPRGAVYVNTGQVLLGSPWPFGWLARRPDVKAVMMIHDTIPIDHPEYAGPFLAHRHARALATAARHATAMLATSHAAAADVRRELRRHGRGDMPFCVEPLPVSASLLDGAAGSVPAPAVPYVVTVGVIDQRKNHRLLLHVWRDMIRGGVPVPTLVVVGARGLRVGGLVDLARRAPGLGDAVVLASGLSSPALRDLIRGARALLMPSFAEGFGLPIAEAVALGVPVIASDIPAHREVGGTAATYLDPLDGPGWRHAVLALTQAAPVPRRPAPAAPQSWDSYFAAVLPFLETL